MIDYFAMTYEMAKDLPPEEFKAWANFEPEAATPSAWPLGTNEGRCGFVEAFCWYGEEVLFEAVNHAWNSLSEPRAMKCIYIGMFAGTGGSGKWALAQILKQALREYMACFGEPPLHEDYPSIDELHRAMTAFWDAQHADQLKVIQKYADILNGEPGRHAPPISNVIEGPWRALASPTSQP